MRPSIVLEGTDVQPLAAHLSARYGVEIRSIRALARGVFDVQRADGSRWVARVQPGRPTQAVRRDAVILKRLAQAGFPAERCADPEPVSTYDGTAVLVTEFVTQRGTMGPGALAARLGALLGRLHAAPADGAAPGGAWHHLAAGTPRDEVAAALSRVHEAGHADGERGRFERLMDAVSATDDCHDLPHAFVHPDFVAANAIPTDDEHVTIVDWAGAGRGPRLWSLGFCLFAAGARSPALIAPLLTRYTRHVALEPEEIDRLGAAVRARPVMLEAWAYATGRRDLAAAMRRIAKLEATAQAITAQARQILEETGR